MTENNTPETNATKHTPAPEGQEEAVHCFDFDGTLTTRDTLIEFIRFARGTWRLVLGFALYSPLLVLMKLRLYPNWKAKQKIFTLYFRRMRIEAFNRVCREFAHQRQGLLRPAGIELIREALERKERVLVVSASIDNWVSAFFTQASLYGVQVLGTRVEVENGQLTGRFETRNCYGEEKVRRIQTVLRLTRNHYHLTAYGDSRGDREMLAAADEAYFMKGGRYERVK